MQRIILALLALLAAAPAAGQEWLVNRERFRYIGTRLTIDVVADGGGRLQVIRGQDGWLGVASRAPAGFTTSGLTDGDHLTLSAAAGGGVVDYMVTVPEGVWVVVRLPDRHYHESVGGFTRTSTFDWQATAAAPPVPAVAPLILPADELGPGLFTTYSASLAPSTVTLPDLHSVRTLTVRTGADRFRIAASRPLNLEPGSPATFEIRPRGEPIDIVIELPAGTASFGLSAAGVPALQLDGETLTPRCGPLTRQWLSGGREWVTFTPVDGRLDCGTAPARTIRHSG